MLRNTITTVLIIAGIIACTMNMTPNFSHAMPNPMVSYDTIEEAEQTADTLSLTLPEDYTLTDDTHLTLTHIFTIADSTIDLRYSAPEDNSKEIRLRAASKDKSYTENISGVYTKNWKPMLVRKAVVNYAVTDSGMQAAYWSDRGRHFSATADGISKKDFINLLKQIVF